MVDFFLKEYGYTVGALYSDFDVHPEVMGGLMAVAEARHEQQAIKQGTATLKESDIDDPEIRAKWAEGRSRQSKQNLAGADAALAAKFPSLMR